jgi:sporulation protein YlmC with PRC-barrel domain
MNRLSPLEDMHVVTEAGQRLGRVFEVRSPGRAETEPTHDRRAVDCLLCGRRGLLERLGWKEPDAIAIPWRDVVALQRHTIVVRSAVDSYQKLDAYRSETR